MSDFINWLAKELEKRNLSHRKLGKKAGISNSLISKVLSEQVPITADFCIKVAQALGESPEEWAKQDERSVSYILRKILKEEAKRREKEEKEKK